MALSPAKMVEAILSNLEEKTGRSLEQWTRLLKTKGPKDPKQWRDWLKSEHRVGHVTAGMIAREASGNSALKLYSDGDALVGAMFDGDKAPLRPVYEALVKAARKLGKDVEVQPRKTYVALVRGKQFAILKPGPGPRLDLGLALADVEPAGKLERARSMGSDRITHKLPVANKKAIDAELVRWMKAAYEQVA